MKNILKFATTRRIASLVAGVAMVGMLVGGNMGTAFASDPTPTFGLNGTSAAMTSPTITINNGTAVAIDGNSKSIPITMPITVTDFSGTGAGWNVTLQATTFTTTDGTHTHTLLNDPKVAALPAIAEVHPLTGTPGTYNDPVDSTSPAVVAELTSIVSGSVVLANATVKTGMGEFTITPIISLQIQSNDYASLSGYPYSSTFTVTFTATPVS